MDSFLTDKQVVKLSRVKATIDEILVDKIKTKNSKPVFLKINMAQGGFRSIEEFKQEAVNTFTV